MPLSLPPPRDCPDCGAKPGAYHGTGCDVERCGHCGGQYFSCACDPADITRERWSGVWPGMAECHEFGLYCVRNPDGPGYLPCGPDEPGAGFDLNRLVASPEFAWDRDRQRYVRSGNAQADRAD